MDSNAGAAIFIGDELTAAGFRLTGMATVVPEPEAAGEALEQARQQAALVIMTADLARNVPAAQLEAALIATAPTLAIVPDVCFRTPVPDLARRLRRALGIEE
jgi:vacuolar-type H+-ATPase subunit F/Vma7